MLEYNGKKNILYAYKNALARPQLEVESENDVVYKSFLEYKNGQCAEDVMEVFLPAMHQALKCQPEALSIQPGRIEIKQVDKGYFNDMTYHVCVHFHIAGADDSNADDVTIIKLPMVDSNGIIEYEGRKYAFIHMLEQEPTVSFEANEATSKAATLKIKNGKRSIWIDDDAKRIRFRMSDRNGKSSKTKYTLIDLIAAMAKDEGLDIYKIWDEFANFTICNMFKDETDKTCHLEYYGMNTGSVNAIDYSQELVPRLTLQRLTQSGVGDISYDNTTIREDINRLLSLDRAVGETLAKDVYSVLRPNIKLAEIGTTIDENLIDVFNSEGVYCVYVNCMPNIEGYYLAEDVYITYAPPGLKLTSDIREHFPDEKGMYLSRYYDKIPVPIIYSEGDALTMSMIETIAAFGMDNVKVSDKKSGGVVKTLNFYEEIMSNKQFLGDKIGKESGVWYYLNKDNVFVQNKGSYTTYDFIALQSFCVKLFEGKWIGKVINADAGFRKQLVPLSEQYRRAFAHAVREGFKKMNRKYKTIWGSNKIFFHQRDNMDNNFYPLSKAFWEYLRDEAKCLVALQNDNVHNPIAYQSACTKVNVYTANKHSIADSQREIAIGSYGKIDPYEIPQSQKLGTVYNSTCGSQISTDGVMKTLYYELIHLGGISKILKNRIISLTSAQEEQYVIADICSLDFDESGIITNNNANVLCRVPSIGTAEKQTFANKKIKEIKYVNINATQPLSWASSTIPFMGSNDAARAIFAVAQEKQAKGIINPEEPDVMTSAYEQFSWLNDKFGIRAKSDGVVDYINYNSIEEEYTMGVLYEGQDGINSGTDYTFKEFFDSGYSVTKLNVLVKKGDKFKKGDMLVSSNFISENGILQFGRNALVAFHCDGYNYEDGSHISQSMCESLASYRINKVTYTGSPEHTKSYRLKKYPIGRWLSKDEGSNLFYCKAIAEYTNDNCFSNNE